MAEGRSNSDVEAASGVESNDTPALSGTLDTGGGPAADRPAAPTEAVEVRGVSIGRFMVVDVLGEGGMGTVLSAYDPTLNRRVAVKILRTVNEEGKARFLREAQAMAKMQHANVVTVFDTGEHEGGVFIAMEFVEGRTFRNWLVRDKKAPETNWREALQLLIQAGHGLAAAHEHGLVHRDFKPENILLGEHGEVKVADFGIVSSTSEPAEPVIAKGSGRLPKTRFDTKGEERLTIMGDTVGTPPYMAPEQFDGTPIDASADQFVFCIVLYEAIYGCPPFAGDTLPELAANVRGTKFAKVQRDVDIPGWLRTALLRGLAPAPKDRFLSMNALLEELSRDRSSKFTPRRLAIAGALVASAAAATWFFLPSTSPAVAACHDSQTHLTGVWDDTVKGSIKTSFDKTKIPYAATVYKTVEARLDDRANNWVSMRDETCEATRVHKTQSVEMMDLRMACLERQLHNLSALTSSLATVDARGVTNAAEAAMGLQSLESCSLTTIARAGSGTTFSHADFPKVSSLQRQLGTALVKGELGKRAEAVVEAHKIRDAAKELNASALAAEASLLAGRLEWREGDLDSSLDSLLEAYTLGYVSDSPHTQLRAAAELVYVLGWEYARPDEGLRWGQIGNAIVESAAIEGKDKNALDIRITAAELRKQDFAAAKAHTSALLGELDRPGSELTASLAYTGLGMIATHEGDLDQALAHYQKSLELAEQVLGAGHPDTSEHLNNLGTVYAAQGEYEKARESLLGALAVAESAHGEMHPDVADPLNNLAAVEFATEGYEAAASHLERAVKIVETIHGEEHADLATVLTGLGSAYSMLDRPEDALKALERALRIRTASSGNPEDLAEVQFALAQAEQEAGGDETRARLLAERAALAFGAIPEYSEQAAATREWLDNLVW